MLDSELFSPRKVLLLTDGAFCQWVTPAQASDPGDR